MEQLTLLNLPYKYIIDASSIISQKDNDFHPRNTYKTLWDKIDKFIVDGLIVTCSEIADEIKDDELKIWMSEKRLVVLGIDYDIQQNVKMILADNPKMIKFSSKSGCSSGDPFLIATAMKYGLTVVTEENRENPNKIPKICEKYGICCVNITGLAKKEGWVL